MSTLSFIAGMRAGAFCAVILILLWIKAVFSSRKETERLAAEDTARSLAELKRRNDISEMQLEALQKIASK